MKFKDVENDLYVVIDAQVLRQIEKQAVCGFPNEDGGMLVGRYSDDKKTVFVTRVIAPTMKLSTRTGFERKVDGMEGMWEKLSKERKRSDDRKPITGNCRSKERGHGWTCGVSL